METGTNLQVRNAEITEKTKNTIFPTMSRNHGGLRKSRNYGMRNPRKGGPGILVMTETGRELKGQREALEILNHYYFHLDSTSSHTSAERRRKIGHDVNDTQNDLTLDDEINLLKNGVSVDDVVRNQVTSREKSSPFSVYDTGCKGTVFIMSKTLKADLIPTNNHTINTKNENLGNDESSACNEVDGNFSKHEKVENLDRSCSSTVEKNSNEEGKSSPYRSKRRIHDSTSLIEQWDPIATVTNVLQDIMEKKPFSPRSRFVLRMIPIQVTCFASLKEIETQATTLIESKLLPYGIQHLNRTKDTLPSFKINCKKRNCSHISREDVIDLIAEIVERTCLKQNSEKLFRVNLSDPDYTITIEVCRTLAGMSIIKSPKQFRNFNLIHAGDDL